MSKKTLVIDNKKFEYTEVELYLGRKKVDVEIIKKILFDLVKVLEENEVFYGLAYGTLLGAIRENNIIEHDEDADIYILEKDRNKVLKCLFELRKLGLELIRYNGDLISLMRDNEYIDIYIFGEKSKFLKWNYYCNDFVIKKKYLIETIKYDCLNYNYQVPKNYEKLLIKLYGNNWKVPIKDKPANNYTLDILVKHKIKKICPVLIYDSLKSLKNYIKRTK